MRDLKIDKLKLVGIVSTVTLLILSLLAWGQYLGKDFYGTILLLSPTVTSTIMFLTLAYVKKHSPEKLRKMAIIYTTTIVAILILTFVLAYFDSRDCKPYVIFGCLSFSDTLFLISFVAIPFLAALMVLESISIIIGVKAGKRYKRNNVDKEEK